MPGEKILITGASGFVGQGLWKHFSDQGFVVTATGRKPNTAPNYVECDLSDPDSANFLLAGKDFDYVLHCAGVKDVRWCESHAKEAFGINADAAGWLAEAAEKARAKFIFLSTDLVFAADRGGYIEFDPTDTELVYGKSKAKGEELVLAAAPSALICRTGGVFGSGSPLLKWLKDELVAGRNVDAFVDVVNSPTYLPDLGVMVVGLLENKKSGIFHTCGSESVSRFDWFRAFAKGQGLNSDLIRQAEAKGRYRELMLFPNSSLICEKTYKAISDRPRILAKAFSEIS
jgi:dTDP-4-dehydrorhamnose reductase